jgi:SAM-dependent methyltransferase
VGPEERTPEPGEEGAATTSATFHQTLHELRTIELERVPKGAKRVLSVGAAGRWYFDWFEVCVGELDLHVGVEAFEPRPDDLPANAVWIESTADHLDGVPDGDIDLVFAGQTTEHLWADELAAFLLEAGRVLHMGGQLVIDSPNRLVTEHLRWTHGGHTVELSADEMAELLVLAGFDIRSVRGLWACRFGGRVHELEDDIGDPAVLARRIVLGPDRPDDSFVWWIVAERSVRTPEPARLLDRVRELYREHWDTRVSRGMWPGPESATLELRPGREGLVSSSLPMMLHAGPWELTVTAAEGRLADLTGLRAAITSPGRHVIHPLDDPVVQSAHQVAWRFDQADLQMALSIELLVERVEAPVQLRMPVSLRQVD